MELLSTSRAVHFLVLALPFAIVVAGWHGLSLSVPAFQAGDEPIHWGILQQAARQWPRPMLTGYAAWSGPLVYWILAALTRPFGTTLVAARLVVCAFSWGTCAMAYVLLRDRLRARPLDALALALLLSISPFFLSQSVHVLTDNLAWFFVVLALERLLAYTERPHWTRIVVFAACLTTATLLRQVALWLVVPGLVAVLSLKLSRRRRALAVSLLVLAVVPLGSLLIYWGGPLPPDPTIGVIPIPFAAGYRTRSLLLSLGVVGWYALFLLPSAEAADWWRRIRRQRRWTLLAALPALAALALLAAGVLGVIVEHLGLVSRIPFPRLLGSSVLWWLLIPLGAGTLACLLASRLSELRDRVLISALLGVLASTVANARWFERYVDAPVLLMFAALAVTAGVTLRRSDRERWLLCGLIGLGAFLWLL